jgi:molybdopterin molybdotransferase
MPVDSVPVEKACGYVLAESIQATEPVQPFRNSAMDGFAVRYGEAKNALDEENPLSIVGEVAAGDPGTIEVGERDCVRIMTGAPVPEGCDTIIRIEDSVVEQGTVHFTRLPSGGRGDNIRDAGEDIQVGETVLRSENLLRPYEVGVGVLAGRSNVDVYRRPDVAVISTGDELVKEPGEPLGPGQIRDINRFTLADGVRQAGGELTQVSTLPDDYDESVARIRSLLENHDILVTSGGISMGEYDFIGDVIDATDLEFHFHKVWQKPGRPLGFASNGETLLFALPGNVVSSMVNFEMYVRPTILRMRGIGSPHRRCLQLTASETFPETDRRTFFFRGRYDGNEEKRMVKPTGTGQGSHIMTSLSEADCIVEVPPRTAVEPGDRVTVWELNHPRPVPLDR